MAMQAFVGQLAIYGQTHPDFQPILKKYGIVPPPVTNAPAKPAAAAPAAPAAPKK